MRYTLERVIGRERTEEGRFRSSLRGIALDASGRLYVVGDRQVRVFGSDGIFLRGWPTSSPGISVAIREDGSVFVGEAGQIEIFTAEGERLDTWRDRKRFGVVTAIGFHQDAVFVADGRAPGIARYDPSGRYVLALGESTGRRGFVAPGGYLDFAVDAGGVVHAANPGKHRVERYSPTGDLLGKFGRFGMRDPAHFRGCCNPVNVAVTRSGHLVVSEKAPPRVKVFGPDRKLETVIDHEFDPDSRYMDLAVDSRGDLYVADSVRLEICVFALGRPEDAERSGTLEGAKR